MTDHYETLGVPRHATPETIKAAYRRLASSLHPDRSRPEERAACGARMAEVNRAYHVLGDTERRAHYDRTGADSATPDRDALAEKRLLSIFDAYLQQDDEHRGDLVQCFRHGVQQHQAQARQQIAAMQRKLDLTRRRRSRLAGGESFAMLCDQRIQQCQQAIARAEDEVQLDDAVLRLLDQYRDIAPPAPETNPYLQTSTLGGLGAFTGFQRF